MQLLSLRRAFHYSILKGREVCAPRLRAFRKTCGRAGMVILQNGTTAECIMYKHLFGTIDPNFDL